ncbi:unnamed protein product [Lactuca saligna]|uniref:BAR domain-containing protein n=1 Tax=Lactuca saligna TaxID=75948 RepID=A0AA35YQ87_LACSI|nr:unnamed protein product [Lactuca saligna]
MKTPFKKLRGLGLHRHNTHRPPAQLDELSQASQDMHDMKDCYDSLLSAAAATANSAYEFSESLREMGDCLLEKTSLNDDEDSGRVLLMLGKVQFEIQKLVDNYRAHISRTITAPSESLLSELRVVEEMKRQCDEKRMTYDEMKIRHKDKRKSGGEYVSSNQLRAAQEEFDEDATLFVFRMKSLKKGQSRSLLTQAARHHAAQMCFFRKSLRSLEAIEPHVMLVTQQQHIDYQFSGLEEEEDDDADDDDRNSVFLTDDDTEDDSEEDMHQDGELSFEYQRGDPKNEASSSENSMELDSAADITFPQVAVKANMAEQRKPLWSSSTFGVEVNAGSKCKSAPLSASAASSNMNMERDPRQMRQSSARKLNTYVLPTPTSQKTNNNNNNLWHSSPLVSSSSSSGPIHPSVLSKPTPLPSPTASQIEQHPSVSAKKIKIYAFSGPLAGSSSSRNRTPLSATVSGPIPITHTPLASTTKLSGGNTNTNSNSFVSSPKISELHELPRPPANLASIKVKPPLKPAFSAPLVTITNKPLGLHASSQRMLSPSPPRTPISISIRNS